VTVDQRVVETRTEVRVEEVENTRFECAVCELVHDAGDVITVGLDRQPTEAEGLFESRKPEVERIVCTHCAEGLFDYSADGGWTPEREGVLPDRFVERMAAYATVSLFLSVPVGGVAVWLAFAGVPALTAAGYGALLFAAVMGVARLL